jgi:outer membrane protein assembly factor BamB
MRSRFTAALLLVLAGAALAPSQPSGTYSKAVPPDRAALDRLNLRTEWVQFIPVEGTRDALAQVQTIGDQVFVQTREGLFLAIDARTGRIQWAARLGNGGYANAYPCAANSQFVFVAHVTKLYAFYRYTGQVEFVSDTGTPPTTGLAADEAGVFCVLGMRPGSAGAHRVAVFNLPRPVAVNEPVKGPADPLGRAAKEAATSPVDDILKRYAAGAMPYGPPEVAPPMYRPNVLNAPVVGTTGSKTPSLSTLPSVVPPYALGHRAPSPSLNPLPSIHPPYHLRLESGRYIQQTPSLGVIPPSVAASLILSDLRPKGVAPPLRWEYGVTASVLYPLHLTPTRAWAVLEGNAVLALNKISEPGKVVTEVRDRIVAPVAAPPAASGTTHFIPLGNGSLIAIDASTGNLSGGMAEKWRADVGGLNNHTPFVTKTRVYASGASGGVTCVDRAHGDIIWRSSDKSADRVIGANEEFVYVRDHRGRLLVYDARRATDPARHTSAPLGSANLPEFNVPVVNTASDRIYLAANNGLIVCLRDAAPKYAKPVSIWPPAEVNPGKRVGVDVKPGKGGANPEPKKDGEPKKEPIKE